MTALRTACEIVRGAAVERSVDARLRRPGTFRPSRASGRKCYIGRACGNSALAERRTAVLIDPKMSGRPACLTEDSGVNSGQMIPQVTAAALVSENKSLAFPASVDSIPTSAGQEDHVSMAPIAARKAAVIARNAAGVVAVELIASAQGVDCHAPLKTSAKLQAVYSRIRQTTPRFTSDRYWADDMAALQDAVLGGEFNSGAFLD